jgi:hypothetical protein
MSLPLCEQSDLPRVLCAHCDSFTMTEAESSYLAGLEGELVTVASEGRTRVVDLPAAYGGGGWSQPQQARVLEDGNLCGVTDCARAAGDAFVCPQCLDGFEVALGDVPALLEDLLVTVTRQHRVAPAGSPRVRRDGTRWDGSVDAGSQRILLDEGFDRVPFVAAASNANQRLCSAVLAAFRGLGGRLQPDGVSDVSRASRWLLSNLERAALSDAGPKLVAGVVAAHGEAMRVIDGPEQAEPLWGQEALRERLAGSLLSVSELAALSQQAGSPFGERLSRDQLNGWVRRGRLQSAGSRPHPSKPVEQVALYRVADVLKALEVPATVAG